VGWRYTELSTTTRERGVLLKGVHHEILWYAFWCHSIDLKFLHIRGGEWSFALRLSAATVIAPYWELKTTLIQMLFWRNNIEDGNCPSLGLFAAPELEYPGLSLISYVKQIEKYLAFEPRSGSKSQLTTPRRENRKIRQENKILKANEPARYV
jgi:hypothetical protein